MKLTEHFSLSEFIKSYTADRWKIDNTPQTDDIIDNLRELCINVLEPIRNEWNKPLKINSGYRCPALNRKVKGARNSQHKLGKAVDIEFKNVPNRELYEWIKANLEFDQLILEFHNPAIPDSGWVHVSFSADKNRKQALEIK